MTLTPFWSYHRTTSLPTIQRPGVPRSLQASWTSDLRSNASSAAGWRAITAATAGMSVRPDTNADNRLALDSLGRVERGDGVVEGRDVADVRPQPTIPDPLDD